jgi:hypothetical protein
VLNLIPVNKFQQETQHTSLPSAYVKTRILERAERPGSNRRLPHTKRKTKTQKQTATPVFEETLEYCLHEADLRHRRLEVSVWHDSRLSVLGLNTVLGRCLVSLDAVAAAIYDGEAKTSEGTTLTDWHVLSHEGEDAEARLVIIIVYKLTDFAHQMFVKCKSVVFNLLCLADP